MMKMELKEEFLCRRASATRQWGEAEGRPPLVWHYVAKVGPIFCSLVLHIFTVANGKQKAFPKS